MTQIELEALLECNAIAMLRDTCGVWIHRGTELVVAVKAPLMPMDGEQFGDVRFIVNVPAPQVRKRKRKQQ